MPLETNVIYCGDCVKKLKEIRRAEREEGLYIEPKTVNQIVEGQLDKSLLESI